MWCEVNAFCVQWMLVVWSECLQSEVRLLCTSGPWLELLKRCQPSLSRDVKWMFAKWSLFVIHPRGHDWSCGNAASQVSVQGCEMNVCKVKFLFVMYPRGHGWSSGNAASQVSVQGCLPATWASPRLVLPRPRHLGGWPHSATTLTGNMGWWSHGATMLTGIWTDDRMVQQCWQEPGLTTAWYTNDDWTLTLRTAQLQRLWPQLQ